MSPRTTSSYRYILPVPWDHEKLLTFEIKSFVYSLGGLSAVASFIAINEQF